MVSFGSNTLAYMSQSVDDKDKNFGKHWHLVSTGMVAAIESCLLKELP
jgi:hypothetical protein